MVSNDISYLNGLIVSKLGKQIITSESDSHWVTHITSLVVKLDILSLWNFSWEICWFYILSTSAGLFYAKAIKSV